MLQKYGLTPEDYAAMLANQCGVCAICEKVCKTGRGLAVDHNHTTGVVRGLLCANCNRGIGMMQDDPTIVAKAHAYLTKTVTLT